MFCFLYSLSMCDAIAEKGEYLSEVNPVVSAWFIENHSLAVESAGFYKGVLEV